MADGRQPVSGEVYNGEQFDGQGRFLFGIVRLLCSLAKHTSVFERLCR